MTRRVHKPTHEAGFTIIEVLVAIFVLLIGVLATTTLLNTANATTERNQARNGATNLVRDIIEASRSLPYESVNPTKDTSGATDNALMLALQNMAPVNSGSTRDSSFADDSATTGWQIDRRDITYTITIQACVIDDAKDKVASATHTPASDDGYWCPNLPTGPTGDGNGDDYRRVKVTAAWTSSSCGSCASGAGSAARTLSVTETAVIVNPSGGLGPPPVGSPTWSNITSCSSATVTQTFAPTATQAVFSVRDPANTTFTASTPTIDGNGNKAFSFTYNPSSVPPDGTYEVDINGLNSQGLPGQTATTFLYINCEQAPAPTNVTGGFNWRRCTAYPATCGSGERVFDIDWNPSTPDTDILGYYVWRVNGTPDYAHDPSDTGPDTKVDCVSRAGSSTTQMPGQLDFVEGPFQPTCWDAGLPAQPTLVNPGGLTFLGGARADYWVQAVDPEPNNPPNPTIPMSSPRTTLTNHSQLLDPNPLGLQENELNVRPTSPVLSVRNDNGVPCLSWTDSLDLDFLGGNIASPIRFYRIYRDSTAVATLSVSYWNGNANVNVQVPDVPYKDRIGRAQPNSGGTCDSNNASRSWFRDTTAGGDDWNYWVTAVDQTYLESFPSNTVNWSSPS